MVRKKIDPIIGLGKNIDKLIVQKSRPLLALSQSDLTLTEFKILDMYLARINSHQPEKRTVILEKGEIEACLGVQRINMEDLDKRLKNLMTSVRLDDLNTSRNRFVRVSLFEEAIAEQSSNGLWKITLSCTKKAMKYFFSIDDIGYAKYKLKCIANMTSRYTYIMFIYLESNRRKKVWEIDLDELKHILSCDQEEIYKEFKFFNSKILKKAQNEIHEKTECRYSYKPIRKGRSVAAIRFELKIFKNAEKVKFEYTPDQVSIADLQDTLQQDLWEDAVQDFNFSKEQMDELREVLEVMPLDKMPQSPACQDAPDLMRYHYMCLKAAEIKRRDAQKPIRDKYAYLLKVLKKDADQA